ncbi:hypothetical protein N9Q18_00985 [bacterium]|nr:hypothetical protein [bacterium]
MVGWFDVDAGDVVAVDREELVLAENGRRVPESSEQVGQRCATFSGGQSNPEGTD